MSPPERDKKVDKLLTMSNKEVSRLVVMQRLAERRMIRKRAKVIYQIQTPRPTYALRHAAVTVCLDAQGKITLSYKGKSLDYTFFHQQAHQAEIVESKHIDRAILNQSKAHTPAANHPWRKGFAASLSKSRDVPPRGDISTLESR